MPADILSEYGSVDYEVGTKASSKMLYKARQQMAFNRIAMQEDLPKHSGNAVNFQVWENFRAATSPLLASVTPQGMRPQATDVVATLEILGNWAPLNRHVQNTLEDNFLQRLQNLMAYNMKDSIETINAYILKQGDSVFYSNADTVRTNVDKAMTLATLRDAVGELESLNAPPITELISVRPDIINVGIEEAYFAFCHSHIERTVRDLAGFVSAARYPTTSARLPNEIGSVENVRFIRCNYLTPYLGGGGSATDVKNTAGVADVYPVLIFAKDAFGVTKLEGTEFNKMLIANPQPSSSDPMAQRGSAAWLAYHACSIIDQDRMTRIECAATIATAV